MQRADRDDLFVEPAAPAESESFLVRQRRPVRCWGAPLGRTRVVSESGRHLISAKVALAAARLPGLEGALFDMDRVVDRLLEVPQGPRARERAISTIDYLETGSGGRYLAARAW